MPSCFALKHGGPWRAEQPRYLLPDFRLRTGRPWGLTPQWRMIVSRRQKGMRM